MPIEPCVRVPFVLVVKSGNDENIARLAEFEAHALPQGNGQVFIALEQAFVRFGKGFDAIFDKIPAAVKALIENIATLPNIRIAVNFLENNIDGRWIDHSKVTRILASPKAKTVALVGGSATAMVGLGLYCALTGKIPDARIIALAEMDESGRLSEVEAIPDKIKASANSGLFDTIIVANDQSEQIARNTLRTLGKQPDIRIQQASTLEELIYIPSTLTLEVLDYLKDIACKSSELPSYFPRHLHGDSSGGTGFNEIRQMVRVIEDRTMFDKWMSQERERLLRAGVERAALAYGPSRGLPEHEIGTDAGSSSAKTLSWDERIIHKFVRVTILGDPGFGKTWLIRYEARRLARKAIHELESHSRPLDKIDLPVYLRLSDLTECESALDQSIAELIRQNHSERLSSYLRKQLVSGKSTLLLDAWDEVSDLDKRRQLRERIFAFASKNSTRILLTSRIVGYDLTQPPLPNSKELELLAFNWSQIESFVQVWFGKDIQEGKQFLTRLKDHPQFRGLARIPLMLTMLCQACPEGDFPSRRSDLYRRCLRGLLRDWYIQDKDHLSKYSKQKLSDAYIAALIAALERASFELFERGYQQFREDDLRRIFESWLTGLHSGKPWHELVKEGTTPTELIERFKDDGILISATNCDGGELLFLHLTFQEYLAARALALRTDSIEEALKHVYEPAWNQVLVMLGCTFAEPPAAYIAALLRKNREDMLCRPLQIALQAAVEAGRDQLPPKVFRSLAEIVAQKCLTSRSLGFLIPIPPLTIRHLPEMMPDLVRSLKDPQWSVRCRAAESLGIIGSEQTIEPLAELLRIDQHSWVRENAARALANIGSEQAMDILLEAFKDDYDDLQPSVVWVLGNIGSQRVTEALIDALQHAATRCQMLAAMQLGNIGSEQALEPLLEVLKDTIDLTRGRAAQAIGKIGSEKAVEPLLEALKSENKNLRDGAARALGELRCERAIKPLLELFKDKDFFVPYSAARAIGKIRSEQAIEPLMEALKNEDEHVRVGAVAALGGIGCEQAIEPLLEALKDEDFSVRRGAAEALKKIGCEREARSLLEALEDEDHYCRILAAETLSRINSERAVKSLAEELKEQDAFVRLEATETLGRINSEKAVGPLLEALKDQDHHVRSSAAEALGNIYSEKAVRPLMKALKDKDAYVRWKTANALGKIGSKEAVGQLVEALKDEDAYVRSGTANALGKIGSDNAVGSLIEALNDADEYLVRPAAAEALRRIGSEKMKGFLLSRPKNHVIVGKDFSALLKRLVTRRKLLSTCGMPANVKAELKSLAASLEELGKYCEHVDGS